MTRINSNIKPSVLIDQHLLAEYNEITRIALIDFNKTHVIPITFRLGAGHVKFFYDKQKFLHERYLLLRNELVNRNISVNSDYSHRWIEIKENYPSYYNSYEFNSQELLLSTIRLIVSIMRIYKKSNTIRFNKNEISVSEAINLLKTNDYHNSILLDHIINTYTTYSDINLLIERLTGIEFHQQILIKNIRREQQI